MKDIKIPYQYHRSQNRSTLHKKVFLGLALILIAWIGFQVFFSQNIPFFGEKKLGSDLPDKPRWNVLVILVDTLRQDHLGIYGYSRNTSPNIDRIAQQGIVFEDALTVATQALPAVSSLFASQPSRRLLTQYGVNLANAPMVMAEYLQEQNYRTGAFLTNRTLVREANFHRGFETFIENNTYKLHQKAELLHEHLLPWLAANPKQPFFAYAHYMEVHDPYRAPEEYAYLFFPEDYPLPPMIHRGEVTPYQNKILMEGLQLDIPEEKKEEIIKLYDACIRNIDDRIADLFKFLEENNLRENTIIWITSDHGEELFDHGSVKHGYTLYDEILRIPMILLYPGGPKGLRIKGQVDLTDILPTTLELLGVNPKRLSVAGRSLVPMIQGKAGGKEMVISECMVSQKAVRWMVSLRTLEDKWINDRFGGPNEYFDLRADPKELNPSDRLPSHLRQKYQNQIEQWLVQNSPEGYQDFMPEHFSPEMLRIMQSMDYLGTSRTENQIPPQTTE